jgi:hypothetical protein
VPLRKDERLHLYGRPKLMGHAVGDHAQHCGRLHSTQCHP